MTQLATSARRVVQSEVFDLLLERSSPQPVAPQMFHARGECEGGRVDRRRGGVLQTETTAVLLRATHSTCRRVRPWSTGALCTFVCFVIFYLSFSPFLYIYPFYIFH